MALECKADNNVPFLPGRKRSSIVNLTTTWCYHRMATGSALSGEAPRTATVDEASLDPKVSAGYAEFTNLTKGGLFTIQGKSRSPLIVSAIDNPAGATLTLVLLSDLNRSRAVPDTFPFKMCGGEMLKATGGATGGSVGFLYELDSMERW